MVHRPSSEFLSWIAAEAERILGLVRGACERSIEHYEPGAFREIVPALHELRGVLLVAGLEGLSLHLEMMEKALERIASRPSPDTEVLLRLRRAAIATENYFLELLHTGQDQPLRLRQYYLDLADMAGDDGATEADLFQLDVAIQPKPQPAVSDENLVRNALLRRFEKGLLGWLKPANDREPLAALTPMREALAGFLKLDAGRPLEPLWLAALAYADALREGRLSRDETARKLLHDLHRTMRHASRDAAPPPRLLKALALAVALLPPRSRAQTLIHEYWHLGEAVAGRDHPLPEAPLRARLDALAEAIDRLSLHWERLTQSPSFHPGSFPQELDAVRRLVEPLGREDLIGAIRALEGVMQWLEAGETGDIATAQIEVARTLLLLSSHCRAVRRDERTGNRLQTQIRRLEALVAGQPLPEIDTAATETDNRTIGVELARLLSDAETLLDHYYRDPTETLDRPRVMRLLSEARATLLLIGADEEARALARILPLIDKLANEGGLEGEEQRQLTETLAHLHARAEALARGEPLTPPPPEEKGATAVPLDELFTGDETLAAGLGLATAAETPSVPGESTATRLSHTAPVTGETGQAVAADTAAVEQTISAGEALREETGETPPTAAPTPVSTRESGPSSIETELLDIFLEEAREVLDTLGRRLPELGDHPDDAEALTDIRRGIHTLKGSGRMVGLTDLGECAWAVEQALNSWLQKHWPATGPVITLIGEAYRLFSRWVENLAAGRPDVPAEAADVARLAARVRDLDSPEEPPEPAQTPAEPPKHVFGDRAISRPLFDAFRQEARERLGIFRHYLSEGASAEPDDNVIRQIHTLAGISGTAKVPEMHDIARALEHALERLARAGRAPEPEELATLRETCEWLDQALQLVEQGQIPAVPSGILPRVENIGISRESPVTPITAEEIAATDTAEKTRPAIGTDTAAPPSAPPATERTVTTGVEPAAAVSVQTEEIDGQLLPVFLAEGQELFEGLFDRLEHWDETGPSASLKAIARMLHTLKGSARMAGALELGERIHLLEQELGDAPPEKARELARSGIDAAYGIFRHLASPATHPPAVSTPREETREEALPAPVRETAETGQVALRVQAATIDRLVNDAGEIGILRARAEQDLRALRSAVLELTDDVIRLRSQLRELEIQAETQMQSRIHTTETADSGFDPLEFDRYTRLQELTRLLAEGIADVATIEQSVLSHLDRAETSLNQQARLTREMQYELMQIRSAPVASIATRLHRIVRQTAKELGKRVNLDIEGGQIALDRALLERLVPLLEHILRNAIAHGIESPAERQTAGKPEFGQITLRVRQLGSETEFLIQDDGKGLDYDAILARARESGLVPPDAKPDEASLSRLIFQPGFSTASEISQIAGRGVGLDVVQSELQALGGRIDLTSTRGRGTSFRILLPATLAITQALLVRAIDRRWAIPANLIVQTEYLTADTLKAAQTTGHVIWMERAYPLRYFPHLLDRPDMPEPLARRNWVVLLASGEERLAIHVDELAGNQEVIAKPSGPHLKRVAGMLGATLLADGEITLIVNPVALARSPLVSGERTTDTRSRVSVSARTKPSVLVVDDSLTVRRITGRLLERAGYEVVLAKDGMDALEKLASLEHLPVAILSDIEMPRMDGFELLRQIRADARTRDLPVVLITSRLAEKHQAHAMALGANAYLGKPYDEDELLRLLRRYRETAAQPA